MFDFGGPFYGWLAGIGVVVLGLAIVYGILRARRQTPQEHEIGERGARRLYQKGEPADRR